METHSQTAATHTGETRHRSRFSRCTPGDSPITRSTLLRRRPRECDDLRVRIESPRADGWDGRLREEGYQNVSYDAATSTVIADLAINHDGTVRHPEQARLPVTNIAVRFD